jgi:hypothetical protein
LAVCAAASWAAKAKQVYTFVHQDKGDLLVLMIFCAGGFFEYGMNYNAFFN